jgi:Maintenance of mitochondrial morphology protein 1
MAHRLGTLMFYDDAEQLEVRHVISLSYYDIDIYGGGEAIPEGELFVKRNCIRMMPKLDNENVPRDAKPFYFFSTNCSEKEDFYHAMLQNQGRDGQELPVPLSFDEKNMEKLIYLLHASKAHYDTRWFNALVGRVFLSLYQTSVVEQIVRRKINKKLSRVAKPTFITALQIKNINLGDSPPLITNPKLREFSKAGDLTVEADVSYKGNARIDVAAVARIDLGQRFKVREVEILLATICKSLEGHIYFRIKPPPTNRIWFSFETMPKMDLSIEPVVSSRQITYSLILRAIESRLREVIAETLVQPNWDDVPFASTLDHPIRGGLWEHDSIAASSARLSMAPTLVDGDDVIREDESPVEGTEKLTSEEPLETVAKAVAGMTQRKNRRSSSVKTDKSDETGVSSSAETIPPATPRSLRSPSFVSAAIPVVSHDPGVVEALVGMSRQPGQDAASAMKDISSRSQPSTPTESPVGSPSASSLAQRPKSKTTPSSYRRRGTDTNGDGEEPMQPTDANHIGNRSHQGPKDSDEASILTESSSNTHQSLPRSLGNKRQSIASTAAAAKKWGLGFVNRHSPASSLSGINNLQSTTDVSDDGRPSSSPTADKLAALLPTKDGLSTRSIPIGRGQPLPPPGQPLPGPPKSNRMSWTAPLSILGRKGATTDSKMTSVSSLSLGNSSPVDNPRKAFDNDSARPPPLPQRTKTPAHSPSLEDLSIGSAIPRAIQQPKLPPRRRSNHLNGGIHTPPYHKASDSNDLLVLKAPDADEDGDSLASYPSDLADRQDAVAGLGVQNIANNDLADEPMGIMDDIDSNTPEAETTEVSQEDQTHTTPEKEATQKTSASMPELHHTDEANSAELLASPATDSASLDGIATTDLDRADPDIPLVASPVSSSHSSTSLSLSKADSSSNSRPRKMRSRQSLIPTPSSSRKHSPSERLYKKDTRRRASGQELVRRASSLSQEADLGVVDAVTLVELKKQ